MEDLLKDLDRVYNGIQHLAVAPTKNNTSIIFDTLQTLEKVYAYLKSETKGNEGDVDA